jgi:hypothetical protein
MNLLKPNLQMGAKFSQILTIGVPVFEEKEGLSKTLASIEGLAEFKSGDIQVVGILQSSNSK